MTGSTSLIALNTKKRQKTKVGLLVLHGVQIDLEKTQQAHSEGGKHMQQLQDTVSLLQTQLSDKGSVWTGYDVCCRCGRLVLHCFDGRSSG